MLLELAGLEGVDLEELDEPISGRGGLFLFFTPASVGFDGLVSVGPPLRSLLNLAMAAFRGKKASVSDAKTATAEGKTLCFFSIVRKITHFCT